MADAEFNLSSRLNDIACKISDCHEVANWLAYTGCDKAGGSMLALLEDQLGRLAEKLMDISESDEVRALDRKEAVA